MEKLVIIPLSEYEELKAVAAKNQLNETAKTTTEIINRAEAKMKAEKKQNKKLKDILEEEKPKKPRKTRTTITDTIRAETMVYLDSGFSVKETAELVGISPASVFRIMNKVPAKE